jgi:hypothetical protein
MGDGKNWHVGSDETICASKPLRLIPTQTLRNGTMLCPSVSTLTWLITQEDFNA